MEESYKTKYQVIMNNMIKEFEIIEEVATYLLKNKNILYYCSIKKVVGKGCVNFKINRITK